MTGNAAIIVAVVVAVASPLVAYLTAAKKLSGKIGTSEASELWAESSAIRDDYRQRISGSEHRVASLEERVARLEQLNMDLIRENRELVAKVSALERENDALRRQIEDLERQLNGGSHD